MSSIQNDIFKQYNTRFHTAAITLQALQDIPIMDCLFGLQTYRRQRMLGVGALIPLSHAAETVQQ